MTSNTNLKEEWTLSISYSFLTLVCLYANSIGATPALWIWIAMNIGIIIALIFTGFEILQHRYIVGL